MRPWSWLHPLLLGFVLVLPHAGAQATYPALAAEEQASSSLTTSPATFSVVTGREPIVSLIGKWHFHPGDDPSWALPDYDDSAWPLLLSDRSWSQQGYKDMSGYGWYRFRVVLPPGDMPFSLLLPRIYSAFTCFADGKAVATFGGLPPKGHLYRLTRVAIDLPKEHRSEERRVVIALRVWHDPTWSYYRGGGPQRTTNPQPVLGPASWISQAFENWKQQATLDASMSLNLAALELLAAFIASCLFAVRRAETEYLWFAIAAGASGLGYVPGFLLAARPYPLAPEEICVQFLTTASSLAYLLFYRRLLHGRVTWLFRVAVFSLVCRILTTFSLDYLHLISIRTANLAGAVLDLATYVWILHLLVHRTRQKMTDARLLLGPVFLVITAETVRHIGFLLQLYHARFQYDPRILSIDTPFAISAEDATQVLFLLAMLAILVNRFARTSREQDRIHTELEAARTVQQVLVPEIIPEIPGLQIQVASHPALEVGGDFFQILSLRSGSTLVVIGDVAGKGMPAALTVSLTVGTLRTLADYTGSPAEILAGLNRRLHGRGTGFTTCLALDLSPDHTTLTVANAGHLSPYLNGRELPTEANLPLGLDAYATFAETRVSIQPGDHLTVLTDGVPEATHNCALLGFERTAELSRWSASTIAESARTYGQTDDITVLTIDVVDGSTHMIP